MIARLIRFAFPVLVIALPLGIYHILGKFADQSQLTLARRHPWTIRSQRDVDPRIVSDEQLYGVLHRLRPPVGSSNTNVLLHALRLWGPLAKFDDLRVPTGEWLRRYFLDDAVFRERVGNTAPPLYRIDTETGQVRVREWSSGDPDRNSSSYHLNDILATLAETGVPLDTPLRTRDGDTTVEQLLRTAMGQFHFRQHEFDWSAISYLRYVYPESGWSNDYGEVITVKGVVSELLEKRNYLTYGPCNGLHRLEAMVVLCGAAEKQETPDNLSGRRTQKEWCDQMLLPHMNHVVDLLKASQHVDGYWTRSWADNDATKSPASAPLFDRMLVTGHHLEWMALSPPEINIPNEMVVRAAQWVVRAIQDCDNESILRNYGPFSHAVRALCLWRAKVPYQAWREYKERLEIPVDPA